MINSSSANRRAAVPATCSRVERWIYPSARSNGEPSQRPEASKAAHSAGRRILYTDTAGCWHTASHGINCREVADHSRLDRLTDRERTALAQMAEGRSNAAIARHLHLAEKTVESHIATLLAKLHLEPTPDDNRRVLAVLAWMRAATR